ncbi:10242_t:CDS:2, partial [Paraglomus occultum]
FGTTFSGFALKHVEDEESEIFINWPKSSRATVTSPKVPTVLLYDEDLNVRQWGYAATLLDESYDDEDEALFAEQFKLHLSDDADINKPLLPRGVDHIKAINDYLRELTKVIRDRITTKWQGSVNFPENVRTVMTVPVEWSDDAITAMRDAALEVGLVTRACLANLEFINEPEAAALYCFGSCPEYKLKPGDAFMTVDCGGGTVDLTTRYLIEDGALGEETESTCETCGSTFVDKEFLKFIGQRLGINKRQMNKLRRDNCVAFQQLTDTFIIPIKTDFTGEESDFPRARRLRLDCPKYHVFVENTSFEKRHLMTKAGWIIDIKFHDVKRMFDTVVDKILRLIHDQIHNSGRMCSALFLVGGFSESVYLQKRIKEKFVKDVRKIVVPRNPICAVMRGALQYGLEIEEDPTKTNYRCNKIIKTRKLRYTYGTEILNPILFACGIPGFSRLAKRGDEVTVGSTFKEIYYPVSRRQKQMSMNLYYTRRYNVLSPFEEDVSMLHEWKINVPKVGDDEDVPGIEMSLNFGQREVTIKANHYLTGEKCVTSKLPRRDCVKTEL